MDKIAKPLYLLALFLLVTVQLYATFSNRNVWPITSFNVFSRTPDKVVVLKAVVGNDEGEEIAVDPGATLPVEFFKARSVYARVFLGNVDSQNKDHFAQRLLARLDSQRWLGIDETLAPARLTRPSRLRVEAWIFAPSTPGTSGLALADKVPVYQWPATPGTLP